MPCNNCSIDENLSAIDLMDSQLELSGMYNCSDNYPSHRLKENIYPVFAGKEAMYADVHSDMSDRLPVFGVIKLKSHQFSSPGISTRPPQCAAVGND